MNIAEIQKQYTLQCWGAQDNFNPLPVERTEGCYIYTTDGRKIFDLRSAHECINLGFSHPAVISRMKELCDDVIYVTDDFATRNTALLARKLADLAPGNNKKKVWFAQSGAGAVEAALKIARYYSKKNIAGKNNNHFYASPDKIISRYSSWHGSTGGAISVSGDPRRWFTQPGGSAQAAFAPEANCYRCPMKHTYPGCGLACAEYIDYMIEMEGGAEKVSAVIMEPIVGSNGIIPPPPGYFERVREICDKRDILIIIDETMTGFGRTGKFFAIEHYNIEPDIIITGKALGVYSPLTAVIMNEKTAAVFDENIFGHGQSYSGHSFSCGAALAGIEVLTETGILEEVQPKGIYLEKKLKNIARKHSIAGDVRGVGLFYTIELTDPESGGQLKKPTEKYKCTVVITAAEYLLEKHGIYIPSDKFGIWIVPPLVVSYEELDFITDAIDDTLTFISNNPEKNNGK